MMIPSLPGLLGGWRETTYSWSTPWSRYRGRRRSSVVTPELWKHKERSGNNSVAQREAGTVEPERGRGAQGGWEAASRLPPLLVVCLWSSEQLFDERPGPAQPGSLSSEAGARFEATVRRPAGAWQGFRTLRCLDVSDLVPPGPHREQLGHRPRCPYQGSP